MDASLAELIEEVRGRVVGLGYELVDLRRRGSGARVHLQVRVDRPGATPGHGISVDECAQVSRALEEWLDETRVLGDRYVLEVSSPGIARPVRWRDHWVRYVGRSVDVKVPGRGRIRASIVRVPDGEDTVVLRPAGEDAELEVMLDAALEATLAVEWPDTGHRGGRRARH